MTARRVVVTGVGIVSPIGSDLESAAEALREGRHGIVEKPAWADIEGLETRLAAEVRDITSSREISTSDLRESLYEGPPHHKGDLRKKLRGMGRVALLALHATEQALSRAGLSKKQLESPSTGLTYGSAHGSSASLIDFVTPLLAKDSFRGIPPTRYFEFMSHTCAANLAHFYEIQGRVLPTAAACVSASLAVGLGYEAIGAGTQEVMICGGAEELHFVPAGILTTMGTTSTGFNDRPDEAPRPFDADRDGLVVGEGAGTVVLEGYEHARRRGATILAEVIGFGTSCDGTSLTTPSVAGMASAMQLALRDAGIAPDDLDYVNAHAVGTVPGDIAEAKATHQVVGEHVPVSSTKSFTGHTLGACGALEVAFCLAMMRDGFLAHGRNLDRVDPLCAPLDYVRGAPREAKPATIMTNNFAFGGINTSLVLGTP